MKENRNDCDESEQNEQGGDLPAREVDDLGFAAPVANGWQLRPARRRIRPHRAGVDDIKSVSAKDADVKGADVKGMRVVDHCR